MALSGALFPHDSCSPHDPPHGPFRAREPCTTGQRDRCAQRMGGGGSPGARGFQQVGRGPCRPRTLRRPGPWDFGPHSDPQHLGRGWSILPVFHHRTATHPARRALRTGRCPPLLPRHGPPPRPTPTARLRTPLITPVSPKTVDRLIYVPPTDAGQRRPRPAAVLFGVIGCPSTLQSTRPLSASSRVTA